MGIHHNGFRVLVIGAVIAMCLQGNAPAATPGPSPNIVLILADDLGYEALGAYGCKTYQTPRLDALAREGLTFKYCFSAPLCTPSRVMLMTGKYGHRNYELFGHFPRNDSANTFGNLLKKAGYATCMAGKWQLKGVQARGMGFDRSMRADSWTSYWGSEGIWIDDRKVAPDHPDVASPGFAPRYRPDIVNEFVLKFIEENRHRPFFVYYPMFLVHHPEQPTPDSPGVGTFLQGSRTGIVRDENVFPDMVAYMDKLVGRVIDKLEVLGLRENTIILFTGDNGTCVHRVSLNGRAVGGGKGSMSDAGTRVPLIACWKGKTPAGTVTDDLVDFSDFYPTLAEAAGVRIRPESGIDGVSFLPQVQGRTGTPRPWAFMHFRGRDEFNWPTKAGAYWARDQRWKLYHDGRLFDLHSDPDEASPILPAADTALTAGVRTRLAAVFQELNVSPETLVKEDGRAGGRKQRLSHKQ